MNSAQLGRVVAKQLRMYQNPETRKTATIAILIEVAVIIIGFHIWACWYSTLPKNQINSFFAAIQTYGGIVLQVLPYLLLTIATIIGLGFIIFLLYEVYLSIYFNSTAFNSIRNNIKEYIIDCNNLTSHIEKLKLSGSTSLSKTDLGRSNFQNTSSYNYRRPHHKNTSNTPNIYQCSRSICSASQQQPIKYLCKYFGIKSNEEHLTHFENILNDFAGVEEGKKYLLSKYNRIMESIANQIPTIILKFSSRKLFEKLGFTYMDLTDNYQPQYVFRHVSPGGNSTLVNTITLDIYNLDALVNYLNDKIK